MAKRAADLTALERRLGHVFADRRWLESALTHVSAVAGDPARSNQRLEFLGDRVLGLAVADMLMDAFPVASEGDLSRRLAELVRRETCAEVALGWDLGPHLKVGPGGGAMRRNLSVLGDACEAVIGAVYRDAGHGAARDLVARAFRDKLATLTRLPSNPKAELQEWAASVGRPPPAYAIADRSGPDHAPRFVVSVRVEGLGEATGTAASRRAAEQAAARALMLREGLATEVAPAETVDA